MNVNTAMPMLGSMPSTTPSRDNLQIFDAVKEGDLGQIRDLFDQGKYPADAVLVGVMVELEPEGSIGPGAGEYFKSIGQAYPESSKGRPVIPVPINSLSQLHSPDQDVETLKGVVKAELEKFDGIVIPGDPFNFPPIRKSQDPQKALREYDGKPDLHDDMTIYGSSAREFYKKFPDHALNPLTASLNFEAEMVRQLRKSDRPVMASCHGMQMYAVMQGATMVAGITGHNHEGPDDVPVKPGSMAHGYLGDMDSTSLHIHKLGLDSQGLPQNLEVVGEMEGVVEIIEEQFGKPVVAYQSHPEFVRHHPSIEFFVSAVVQRHLKHEAFAELDAAKPL